MRYPPPLRRVTGRRTVKSTVVSVVEIRVLPQRPRGHRSAPQARCHRLLNRRLLGPHESRHGSRAAGGSPHRPMSTGPYRASGRPVGILVSRAPLGLSRVEQRVRGMVVVGAARPPRSARCGPGHARRWPAPRWSRGVAVACIVRAGVGVHAGVRPGIRLPVRLNPDPQPDPWTGQQGRSTSDNTARCCRDKPLPGGFPVGRSAYKRVTPGRPWRWR
jgi:hypothetical protein